MHKNKREMIPSQSALTVLYKDVVDDVRGPVKTQAACLSISLMRATYQKKNVSNELWK